MGWIKEEFLDKKKETKIVKKDYKLNCPDCGDIPHYLEDKEECSYCPKCKHKMFARINLRC